jgi:4a-hydroxytetrahydrobiopterin dehydratase
MKLSSGEVKRRLGGLPGWTVEEDALVRTFVFPGFPDAVTFVTRLAFDAEAADHHPDLHVSYKRVTVRWRTHSDDGMTEKDFAGARQSEIIAQQCGSRPATAPAKSPR